MEAHHHQRPLSLDNKVKSVDRSMCSTRDVRLEQDPIANPRYAGIRSPEGGGDKEPTFGLLFIFYANQG